MPFWNHKASISRGVLTLRIKRVLTRVFHHWIQHCNRQVHSSLTPDPLRICMARWNNFWYSEYVTSSCKAGLNNSFMKIDELVLWLVSSIWRVYFQKAINLMAAICHILTSGSLNGTNCGFTLTYWQFHIILSSWTIECQIIFKWTKLTNLSIPTASRS